MKPKKHNSLDCFGLSPLNDEKKVAFTLAEAATQVDIPNNLRKAAFTLAEVFLPHPTGSSKAAFTLAEVLITLGIIGVVAAMTLPTLMTNIQDYTFRKQWKKAYSDFSRAALQMADDYQVDTFKDVIQVEAENYGEDPLNGYLHNNTVLGVMNKYFKVIKSDSNFEGWKCWPGSEYLKKTYGYGLIGNQNSSETGIGYKYLNGVDSGYWVFGYNPTACFVLSDYVFAVDTNTSNYGRFSIDVNGSKKPNVIGRDVYVLNINNLRKPIVGGMEGFYDGAEYECSKDAAKGGPACSAKYLLE